MRMTAERTIDRPADEVAAFFFDAANNPKWQDGMVSCEWVSDPPIGVGSTYEQLARFMGRDVRSTFVVTDLEPGRMIRIETIESTFPIQVERRVDPLDDSSCRVTADITGGPDKGVMKLLSPLMAGRAQKSVDADYDRLVQLLES
ncbi:MAG TPA: SRPBCC family protein [Acidimicrobiia bacterium]